MNLEDYFDCDRLSARMKLRACDTHRAGVAKQPRGSIMYRFPIACLTCVGWRKLQVAVIGHSEYESEVLASLKEALPHHHESGKESVDRFEQRRFNDLSDHVYGKQRRKD